MATTTNTDQDNLNDLRARLMSNPQPVIDALIVGLTEAGVQTMWDSETIELLLEPIQSALQHYFAIPHVGDTGADNHALNYWRSIARASGIGYDEDDEEPWF